MSNNGKSFVCPIDKRQFATKAALAQHRRMVHTAAQPSTSSRRGRGRGSRVTRARLSRPLPSKDCRRVSGTDILGSFKITTKSLTGDVIMGFAMNPRNFDKTRISTESSLFARWRPQKLVLELVPSASAMFAGSYMAGWCADPDEWLDNDPQSVNIVAAMLPSASMPIHQKVVLTIPTKTTQKWFLTDNSGDASDTTHGKCYVVLSAPLTNISIGSEISILARLHWTIELDSPVVPAKEIRAGTIYADSGFESYFTDSVSDWGSGKYLTLKAKEGGNAVTFAKAVTGVVYNLDPNAKLTYNQSSGAARSIYYGVAIKNYNDGKSLAVFEDISKAKQYAKTYDTSKCLVYYSAGDRITPANPAWTQITNVRGKDSLTNTMLTQLLELQRKVEALTMQRNTDMESSGGFTLIETDKLKS